MCGGKVINYISTNSVLLESQVFGLNLALSDSPLKEIFVTESCLAMSKKVLLLLCPYLIGMASVYLTSLM